MLLLEDQTCISTSDCSPDPQVFMFFCLYKTMSAYNYIHFLIGTVKSKSAWKIVKENHEANSK